MLAHDDDTETDDADADGELSVDTSALFAAPCAAFCRGRLGLESASDDDAIAAGRAAGLRLHRFKRARLLPRVQRILSALHGLAPTSLLDVGTGRGVMLWPLLEAFPDVPVTCVDVREDRVSDLEALARGGVTRVRAVRASIEALPLDDKCVDTAIASEVLEHVANPAAAARSLLRVARRFVVVTVPSQPDDNPEHIRLFTADTLRALFAGALRVNVDGVRGHFFAVVTV